MLGSLQEIGPVEAAARLADGTAVALDVREPGEWECGRIAGSVHIPIGELVMRQDEIPEDVPLIAVCRSGSRSAYATELLVRAGYDAVNLAGGLEAWEAAGLPLEPAGGFVA
jgi:rhodanese-related sulfurtransferase